MVSIIASGISEGELPCNSQRPIEHIMAHSKLASFGNRVLSAVKEFRLFVDYSENVCVQCHFRPIDPRERFCSQECGMQYWREFQMYCASNAGKLYFVFVQANCTDYALYPLGKNVCSLPGCSKPCYVEPRGRIHDYCGRTHASEHAAMMGGKKSKSKGNGSKSKGRQSQSYTQSTGTTGETTNFLWVGGGAVEWEGRGR